MIRHLMEQKMKYTTSMKDITQHGRATKVAVLQADYPGHGSDYIQTLGDTYQILSSALVTNGRFEYTTQKLDHGSQS